MGSPATREVRCKTQFAYKNGSMMCTSGSTCLCVLVVAKKMSPISDNSAQVRDGVDMAMLLGSSVQGKVEKRMGKRRNSPISVEDMVEHGDVVLQDAGVQREEFIVHKSAMHNVEYVDPKKEDPWVPRKKTPNTCIIWWPDMVRCMLNEHDDDAPITAVMTTNGHSVFICCERGIFSVFNPADGLFSIGFSREEMTEFLEEVSDEAHVKQTPEFQVDVTLLYQIPKNKRVKT